MNLVITADWPITGTERIEAIAAIRAAYAEILPLANLALSLAADPWTYYPGTLTVVLHATVFDNATRNGQTHWAAPGADSKIEIAWDIQNQEEQNPLLHEFGHWLALQAGDPDWGEFGHGTLNDKLGLALRRLTKTKYWSNFGIGFLGYTEIDFKKPEFHNLDRQFNFKTWEDGVLWCDVRNKGDLVEFKPDDTREYLWHMKTESRRLVTRVFDKDKET